MNKIIDLLRSIYVLPSARVLAIKELEDSKRKLLEMESSLDYAQSMCNYYKSKITRLSVYLKTEVKWINAVTTIATKAGIAN